MESLLAHLARKERDACASGASTSTRARSSPSASESTIVPTLVLVKDKQAVCRLEGRTSAPRIEGMLEPHLAPSSPSPKTDPPPAPRS